MLLFDYVGKCVLTEWISSVDILRNYLFGHLAPSSLDIHHPPVDIGRRSYFLTTNIVPLASSFPIFGSRSIIAKCGWNDNENLYQYYRIKRGRTNGRFNRNLCNDFIVLLFHFSSFFYLFFFFFSFFSFFRISTDNEICRRIK